MAEEHLSPQEERRILDLFERSALADYPNPDRVGCPGTPFLRRLAYDRKSIPLTHPALDHLPHCSPCFTEFVEFRNQARRRRILTRVCALAAAVALTVVAGWYMLRPRQVPPSQIVATNRPEAFKDFRINLQNRSVPRGERAPSDKPLTVPREQLRLSIELPLASEPGLYEAQILAAPDRPLVQASGTATMNDGLTVLIIQADLRSIPPGRYFLGFRRPPWDWTYIPIALE
jgi:hypothetical protein